MIFPTYRTLSRVITPVARRLLHRRLRQGKEDPDRLGERMGRPGRTRPGGPLVWVHAASVGEALSALPVIEELMKRPEPPSVLVTTGTVTSARMMAERLPAGAFHQYIPLDCLPWVRRFLQHWRPDLALWVESELWPNLVCHTAERGTPMVMVNGRMSERSYRRWLRMPGAAAKMLGSFDLVLAQSETDAERLSALGARKVETPGNLKYASAPLPFDEAALAALEARFGADPVWLAASTHPGEEETIAVVHRSLSARMPDLRTIVVPRHPHRGEEIADLMRRHGLTAECRSTEAAPRDDRPGDVYVADTLGELGLFYRLVDIAFIGGSLVAHGGQNPIEAARLDCAILHGPRVENFADVYADLAAAHAGIQVATPNALAEAVSELLAGSDRRTRMARAAKAVAEEHGAVRARVMDRLEPFLVAYLRDGPHAGA